MKNRQLHHQIRPSFPFITDVLFLSWLGGINGYGSASLKYGLQNSQATLGTQTLQIHHKDSAEKCILGYGGSLS